MKILLFHGRGLISALIRWQTRGDFSHAALELDDGSIIEAWQGDGVRQKKLQSRTGITAFTVPTCSPGQWEIAIAFAKTKIGKKYDYWSVLRFISRRHLPENDRWFCSELVFAAFAAAGLPLLARITASEVSPQHLALSPLLQEEAVVR